MSTAVEPEVADPDLGTEDPIVAHIARKDDVTRAYVEGEPITALCGKTWVPSRDPIGRPVCERCQEILKQYRATGSN